MATIVLTNTDHSYTKKCKPGQAVEIALKSGEKLFQGEVVGLEPIYKGKGESKIVLRCFNKLHRLLRGRASDSFVKKSDKEIISQVLTKHGLTIDWKGPEIKHEVVQQHNQTDIEFIRLRAARLGLYLLCTDTKVAVKRPELDLDSGIKFSIGQGISSAEQIRNFMPRMSSAPIVKKVTVRGWDEEKKEPIVGEATPEGSKLGSSQSNSAAESHGQAETFVVDQPIRSVEEAKELAKGRLIELSLGYITGELEVVGNGKVVPGSVIKVIVNSESEDKFNGKYFVAGVSHRFVPDSHDEDGGFVSTFRLQRDAQSAPAENG
jgi:phage protein D